MMHQDSLEPALRQLMVQKWLEVPCLVMKSHVCTNSCQAMTQVMHAVFSSTLFYSMIDSTFKCKCILCSLQLCFTRHHILLESSC